jgi:hypothetical protein
MRLVCGVQAVGTAVRAAPAADENGDSGPAGASSAVSRGAVDHITKGS